MNEPKALLFTDAGVILSNPSPIGGTWAWCLVEASECVKWASGHILKPGITNNQTEFIAVVKALEAMPDRWSGVICSDSIVTLFRLFPPSLIDCGPGNLHPRWYGPKLGCKPNRLPQSVYDRWLWAEARMGKLSGRLVKGHPTKKELEVGTAKGGLPVSEWNVKCDELCRMESRRARGLIND